MFMLGKSNFEVEVSSGEEEEFSVTCSDGKLISSEGFVVNSGEVPMVSSSDDAVTTSDD